MVNTRRITFSNTKSGKATQRKGKGRITIYLDPTKAKITIVQAPNPNMVDSTIDP